MPEDIHYTYSSDSYYECFPDLKDKVSFQLEVFRQSRFVEKIYDFNYFLWSEDPREITNRLGWLYIHYVMMDALDNIEAFCREIRKKGFKHVLLLGMGGSSLSGDVFKDVFRGKQGFPDLTVVDTTDPEYMNELKNKIDLGKTLFVVSTKSGGTVETLSAMKFFYNRIGENPGEHFVGITDPGSKLIDIAGDLNFRKIFVNDPNIGGRFSVLSYFGLVPAALAGVDIKKILESACSESDKTKSPDVEYEDKIALRLGVVMGILSGLGKNKLTFLFSEKLYSFGYWAEQLIAESTGKSGTGILPVLDQKNFSERYLQDDRFFILFTGKDEGSLASRFEQLAKMGFPLLKIVVDDEYQIGREFFRFEFATAVAGSIMKINPFDQPDVESAKVMARQFLEETEKSGKSKEEKFDFSFNGLSFLSNCRIGSVEEFLALIKNSKAGYISLHGYINPGQKNKSALNGLRDIIEELSSLPVTQGFGPRFLHSTGQLHKGDAGKGLFIQLVSHNQQDEPVPDSPGSDEAKITFRQLKLSQAAGDYKALDFRGRRVVSIHLPSDVSAHIDKLAEYLIKGKDNF